MNDLPAGTDRRPAAAMGPGAGDLSAVAALGEPARRALYTYVVSQGRAVSRDEAATATGMKRATAAFHLDRLVSGGLLEVAFARRSGRTGPGAGRTAKLYTRSCRDIAVSLPPRRYELAGDVLAAAMEEAQRSRRPVDEALACAAERAGRQLAASGSCLTDVLVRTGYEPRIAAGGGVQLANCPFHELAQRHPALVCGLNLHLLNGLLAGLGEGGQARLDPAPGHCCVTISGQGSDRLHVATRSARPPGGTPQAQPASPRVASPGGPSRGTAAGRTTRSRAGDQRLPR